MITLVENSISTEEYYEAVVSAKTIGNMVAALPAIEDLTTSYKKALEQIRELYDGLTDYQKKYVREEDLGKLKLYEAKMLILEERENSNNTEDTDNSESSEETNDVEAE